jgi:hypothetical protein
LRDNRSDQRGEQLPSAWASLGIKGSEPESDVSSLKRAVSKCAVSKVHDLEMETFFINDRKETIKELHPPLFISVKVWNWCNSSHGLTPKIVSRIFLITLHLKISQLRSGE